ncbi:MAG TPA: hypothetical protein PLF37_14045 [Planctomycetota bacterium]|nr:hypothetical protein [Planctomycetota bacterium]
MRYGPAPCPSARSWLYDWSVLGHHGDFDLAWLERDEEYAIVTR